MISNSIFPTLSSMLEGYTSERLRNLIELLNDPEINNAHLSSSWIDPKRVPMDILVSLNRRNLHRHIKMIIQFTLENEPNPTRMSSSTYNQKRSNLLNQLKSIGISYEDGVLKTELPNPPVTNQNVEDIKYLLKQHNFEDIIPLLEDFLMDFANNPNTSLGKLRLVFQKVMDKIITIKMINVSLDMKAKIKEIQKL